MSAHEAFTTDAFNSNPHNHNHRITERLAGGGFSTVYLGKDIGRNDEPVAIKVFNPFEDTSANSEEAKAFIIEAERARSLHHPNIVDVRWHGIHEENGMRSPYLVMEHVNGGSLRSRREARGGYLPPEEAVSLIGQVMLGVQHAHNRGIVHRDLKPENVLIATGAEVAQISGFPDMARSTIIEPVRYTKKAPSYT